MDMAEGINLLQALQSQGLDPTKVVVERNSQIVLSENFSTTILEADDILEVLHFVGGG